MHVLYKYNEKVELQDCNLKTIQASSPEFNRAEYCKLLSMFEQLTSEKW